MASVSNGYSTTVHPPFNDDSTAIQRQFNGNSTATQRQFNGYLMKIQRQLIKRLFCVALFFEVTWLLLPLYKCQENLKLKVS